MNMNLVNRGSAVRVCYPASKNTVFAGKTQSGVFKGKSAAHSMPTAQTGAQGQLRSNGLFIALTLTTIIYGFIAFIDTAKASPIRFDRGMASSYGPGLYGNHTACGQTLTRSTRGVAHRTLPCGTRLQICRQGVCTHARMIDRGPFVSGRVLDLTTQTTRELCDCSPYQWGHRRVSYRKTEKQ